MNGIAEKILLTTPAVAGVDALSKVPVNMDLSNFNWSNWAVTAALGMVAFFARRLISRIDTLDTKLETTKKELSDKIDVSKDAISSISERQSIIETKHEDMCGGKRWYDPDERPVLKDGIE